MPFDPAALPDDVDALKAIIADMARDAVAAKSEIEKLNAQLARLKRAQFGRSSEKLSGRVGQLELALKALESDQAERLAATPAMAELVEAEHDKGSFLTHASPKQPVRLSSGTNLGTIWGVSVEEAFGA